MEDDQQFCLRWNNHQSTLVAVFDTLLENGTLVDCTLAAEGKYLNAHKVVLSACSPYFESLLSQNYDKHPIFILKDVKFQELKAMMDYMYRGEVNISQDQLGALLKAAESLQIKGLSDNKKDTESRKAAPPAPAKSPPPTASTNLPRVQGLTIEQRRGNRSMDEREGSLSPGPRKRKRMRRRSTDDLDNHHDASNSSESHSNPPIQNIPIALPPASSKVTNADVPEPVETKSEILSRHKVSTNNDAEIPQVPIIKEKLETHTELMLEPKAEYVEEMNEDSIEDLTLDDDDVSNLDMSNDGAGPSHGNVGEGPSQGFGNWHMGNQSQDEVFLAAQEAVGAHRDSQELSEYYLSSENAETLEALLNISVDGNKKEFGSFLRKYQSIKDHGIRPGYSSESQFACRHCGKRYRWKSTMRRHELLECGDKEPSFQCPKCPYKAKQKDFFPSLPMEVQLTEGEWSNSDLAEVKLRKTTPASKRIRGNFGCINCGRCYGRKDSLQRHITYECGKEPQFQCPFCPQRCKRKSHQMRHIKRMHQDKIEVMEENNPDLKLVKEENNAMPL